MSKMNPESSPQSRMEELREHMRVKMREYHDAIEKKDRETAKRVAREFDNMMTEMHMSYPNLVTSDEERTVQLMAQDLNFRLHEKPQSDTEDKLNILRSPKVPADVEGWMKQEADDLNKKQKSDTEEKLTTMIGLKAVDIDKQFKQEVDELNKKLHKKGK